ncbi:SGNH/GDSL hydrolase family protein [Microbacterium mangrovi]|uniref:SGNH/GDSL hydrolase family protein n=1 Tax=Microbacterium mangrovi TaxID=1348253 RepID=UPI000AE114C5|nr:SGNH/GDSL hydrolase family protein [Microbacterium mangrovi]
MSAIRPVRRRRLLAFAAAAVALLALPLGAAPALAAQPAPVAKYVAVGDSYAAGQGAPGATGVCHVSPLGYPSLIGAVPRYNLLRDPACSGDTIAQVAGTQLSQVNRGTTLVTITAGANDLGIADVYTQCVPDAGTPGCLAAIAKAQLALTMVEGRMSALIAAVHSAAPRATIVVTGYPIPFSADLAQQFPIAAQVNQAVWTLDAALAGAVQQQAAANVAVRFAPVSFAGHEIGTAAPWLGGDPTDGSTFLHPNATGYAVYAQTILAVLG